MISQFLDVGKDFCELLSILIIQISFNPQGTIALLSIYPLFIFLLLVYAHLINLLPLPCQQSLNSACQIHENAHTVLSLGQNVNAV